MKNMMVEKRICRICGKEVPPTMPLKNGWCTDCFQLFNNAQKNHYDMNMWEKHLREHGFVKKWGHWRKKTIPNKA